MDYNNGIKSINNQFSLVESSYIATLDQSLWVYDSNQIQLQLEGLLNLEDIAFASITINGIKKYEAGQELRRNKKVKTFALNYLFNGRNILLGTLTVHANLDNLYNFLKKKVIVILFSQAIKTFFISFFILFLFQKLVTRHLETIARFLSTINPIQANQALKLHKKSSHDELDQVTTAINTMQQSLHHSYQALSNELIIKTEIKNELKKNQQELLQAQKIAKVGNWRWDTKEETLHASKEFFYLIGLKDRKESTMSKDEILTLILEGLNFPLLVMLTNHHYDELKQSKVMELILSNNVKKYLRINISSDNSEAAQEKYIIGTIQDITTEHLTTIENNKLFAAIEQSPILVFITDAKGRIEYMNDNVKKLFPEKSEKLLTQTIKRLCIDHNSSIFTEAYKEAETLGIWEGEIAEGDSQDNISIMKTIICPIKDALSSTQMFTVWQEDITKAKDLNRKMLLQSRHAQMGEMIAMIAHQWRQPLSNISSVMSGLKIKSELDRLAKEDIDKATGDITGYVAHLSQTIHDFSSFFKPNKNIEHTHFNELLKKSYGILGSLFKTNGIIIDNKVPDALTIETYSNELLQVILNLLKNSIDAFKESKIDKRNIIIEYEIKESLGSISFKDNAGGINETIIEDIFTPYFSTKDDKNGTGLGLYMSKTIIEKHMDGKLEVHSAHGTTTFSLDFPLHMIQMDVS